MAATLPLPHKPQQGDGYCLPACVQMVLAHLTHFSLYNLCLFRTGVQ